MTPSSPAVQCDHDFNPVVRTKAQPVVFDRHDTGTSRLNHPNANSFSKTHLGQSMNHFGRSHHLDYTSHLAAGHHFQRDNIRQSKTPGEEGY